MLPRRTLTRWVPRIALPLDVALALLVLTTLGHVSGSPASGDDAAMPPTQAIGSQLISSQAQASLICNVTISASMAGEVSQVNVVEGQAVRAKDRLVTLDDELAQADYVAAQRAFEAASLQAQNEVNARYARRALDVRVREYEQSEAANRQFEGTVSETELDRLRLVVDQSRLAIEQAEFEQKVAMAQAGEKQAAADAAAVRLRKHAILSPRHAQVAEVLVQPGQRVDAGEPLLRLIDVLSLRVECLVDVEQANQCAVGDRIAFQYEPGLSCEGQIEFVSSEVDPVTGQVRILATVDNRDQKLRPGTRGKLVRLDGPPASPGRSQR